MRSVILLVAISLLIISCEKDNESVDPGTFYANHVALKLDSIAIANKLVGTWTFSSQFCGSGGARPLLLGIHATFLADGTFKVIHQAGTIDAGLWRIKKVDVGMWGLELTDLSDYLYGRILFSDTRVMFNNSYVGGCDNVFER